MRTRRSPRNQEILWRDLGRQGQTPTPKPAPAPIPTDAEIDAMWWIGKRSRSLLKQDMAKRRRKGNA